MLKDKKLLYVGISAKYTHVNVAGWFLAEYAKKFGINIEEYQSNVNVNLKEQLDDILQYRAEVLLISVYIFNVNRIKELIKAIRADNPNIIIIIGGPESDDGIDCDYFMQGEGEQSLVKLLTDISPSKLVTEIPITYLDDIPSPYTKDRILAAKNKYIYYESSRGCPFKCTYCMAGLTKGVRYFSLKRVFFDLNNLATWGARTIKFTDRTFNANADRTTQIFKYIIDNLNGLGQCFHFEIGAELLTDEHIDIISEAKPNTIQLEIGVQTLNFETLKAIQRPFNQKRFFDNVLRIRNKGNVHLHLDLIAGLPLETLDTFVKSFNQVMKLNPHELQLGFLKFLKSTPIREYPYGQVYDKNPMYEVVSTATMSLADLEQLREVEWVLDKLYNDGRATYLLKYLLKLRNSDDFYNLLKEIANFLKIKGIGKRSKEFDILNGLWEFSNKTEIAKNVIKFDYLSSNNSRILPAFLKDNCRIKNRDVNIFVADFLCNAEGEEGHHRYQFRYTVKAADGKYPYTELDVDNNC